MFKQTNLIATRYKDRYVCACAPIKNFARIEKMSFANANGFQLFLQ